MSRNRYFLAQAFALALLLATTGPILAAKPNIARPAVTQVPQPTQFLPAVATPGPSQTPNNGSNIAQPSGGFNLDLIGAYQSPGYAYGVAVTNNYAYLADRDSLRVINITNPTTPIVAGFYNLEALSFADDVAVAGNYAYVADTYYGLRIVNVANPTAPYQVGWYALPGALSVAVGGNYAYVADGYNGLQIIDISNPAAPTRSGGYITPDQAYGVTVLNNYAYVAAGLSGLQIVDVTSPANPRRVGFSYTPGFAFGVTIAGSYAYVGDYGSGLRIINVSNVAAPSEVGFVLTPGYAQGVAVTGKYAYVSDGNSGMRVIDVSNVRAPTEIGWYTFPAGGHARGMALFGNNAIIANGTAGMDILRLSDGVALSCFTLAFSATSGGIVTPLTPFNCPGGYNTGTVVVLRADLTAPGYQFRDWTGDAGGTSSIANVVMTSNKTVTANFELVPASQKPIVVLVHGWHGTPTASADTCTSTTSPLHATDINNIPPNDFGIFAKNLMLSNWDVWIAHVATGPNGTPIIWDNAVCLKRQLAQIPKATNAKVVLIAHSMGGLVSRAYLESPVVGFYADDVSRLITLGTPHVGTSYAIAACSANPNDYAACEFSTLGINWFNESYSQRAPGVIYNLIGGYLTPGIAGASLLGSDGLNDGVVGVESAMGRKYRYLFPPASVIDGSLLNRYSVAASHSSFKFGPVPDTVWFPSYFNNLLFPNSSLTEAYQCVEQLLGISGGSCPTPAVAPSKLEAPLVSAMSQTPKLSGHLSTDQVVTRTVPIDTNGHSQVYTTWVTGTLALTLTNPLGTAINPAYAGNHPTEVAYYANPNDPTSPLFAAYSFTTTVPGVYTLTISSGNVGNSGTDYSALALVESSRVLTLETDNTLYSIGSMATITAALMNNGAGLSGATVQMQVYQLGVVTDTVSLDDRGGGIYSGTYTIPNAPGYLGLRVLANGSDAGTTYARQVDSLIAVSPATIQLTGQFSDSPKDSDGNGKYQSLNLDIGITSSQSGNYILSGDLVGGGNAVAAHSVISLTLGSGVLTATLPFNGDRLHNSGLNGPYTLTNLTIADQQHQGVPAVWQAPNLWFTAAYSASDFAASCFVLTAHTMGMGTISVDPAPDCNAGLQYAQGSVVTLTATPSAGSTFLGWSGGVVGLTNPITMTLSSDESVTARFTSKLYLPAILR